MAEALTQHQGIGRQNTVDHSAEIDVDHLVPGLDGMITKFATNADACVVEHEVETSELIGSALVQPLYDLEVRHVAGARCGGLSRCTRDCGGYLLRLGRLQVGD